MMMETSAMEAPQEVRIATTTRRHTLCALSGDSPTTSEGRHTTSTLKLWHAPPVNGANLNFDDDD